MPARSDAPGRRLRAVALGWGWVVAWLWVQRTPLTLAPAWEALGESWRQSADWTPVSFALRELATLRAILVFAAVTVACHDAGSRLLAWIGLGAGRARTRLPARARSWLPALPAGWGLAGTCGFALAACGLFRTPVLAALVAVGAVAGVRRAAAVGQSARLAIGGLWRTAGPWGRVAAACCGMVVAFQGLASLAPETGIDSLIHHLPVAARLVALGSLVPMPGNALFHASALSEVLRAAALALGGEPAARLFGPAATALTVLWLAAGAGARAGADWGWAAAALFASAEPVIGFGMGCKPDVLLAPCGLAVLGVLGREARWRSRRRAVAAGWILGTGIAMKYLAAALGAAATAIALAGGSPASVVLGLVAAMAAPVVPWLLKSALLTGNPVYPVAFRQFGGLELTPVTSAHFLRYIETVTHQAPYGSFLERLAAPWSLTMVDGAPPAWLAVLPLALLGVRLRARSAGAGPRGWRWPAAAGVFLVCWAAGPVQYRYLLPILPVLVWLAVEAMAGVPRRAAAVLAGALIVVQAVQAGGRGEVAGRLPCGLGLEERSAFFRRQLPRYAEALDAQRRLPPAARVLCIGSDAGYPLVRPLLVPNRLQPVPVYPLVRASADPEVLWKKMRQLGVTHVLYNPVAAIFLREWQSAVPWTPGDVAIWEAVWRRHARVVFRSPRPSVRDGLFLLYALEEHPGSKPSWAFLPGTEGVLASVEQDAVGRGPEAARKALHFLSAPVRRYGSLAYFEARIFPDREPRERLARVRAAEAAGYWDPSLYPFEISLGERLGDARVIAAARASLAARVDP